MPVAVASQQNGSVGHNCVDYPITFYIASKTLNSGWVASRLLFPCGWVADTYAPSSVAAPRIIASSCVWFGQGHPLNRTEILYPDSEGYMPDGSLTTPRLSIVNRRSLLRGLLQALVSVKDIYRVGRAATCLHINVSSQYLDIVWNNWLPDWEENGWPSREEEEDAEKTRRRASSIATRGSASQSIRSRSSHQPPSRERANSRASTRMSMMSRADSTISAMTSDAHYIYDDDSNRLVNEDLLRKIAVFRRNFFKTSTANSKGAAYVQLISYRHNPADRLAKESVTGASLDLTTQMPRARSINPSRMSANSIFSSEADSIRPASMLGVRRPKPASLHSQSSPPRRGSGPALSSLQESRETGVTPEPRPMALPPAPMPQRAAPAATLPTAAAIVHASAPAATLTPAVESAAAPPINMSTIASGEAVQRPKLSSKATASEAGYDTDLEEFNDAASTFSNEGKEPESAMSKIVGLPTAIVAATVAAVMAPKSEEKERVQDEPVASNRGSFAIETEKALAEVKASANHTPQATDPPLLVPERTSSYIKPRNNNAVQNGLQREASTKAKKSIEIAREPRKSGEIMQQPSAASRRSDEVARKPSTNGKAKRSGELTRETSAVSRRSTRSTRPLSLKESNNLARQQSAKSATRQIMVEPSSIAPSVKMAPPPSPPPPPPAKRQSFFSLRGMNKKTEGGYFKSSKSSEPYLPPMDRLIDYRPPQGRNLRAGQFGQQEINNIASSTTSSPSKEERAHPPPQNVKAQTTGRGGPFAFFKKRGSVQGVF